jgi:LTXXQ motif family protein
MNWSASGAFTSAIQTGAIMTKVRAVPAILVVVAVICLASDADARRWRYYGGDEDGNSNQTDTDDRRRGRDAEWPDSGLRRGGGAFTTIVDRLIRGCSQQGAEMQTWPFDSIVQIVNPDDIQRHALDQLRVVAKSTADALKSNCPRETPSAPTARFDAVEQAVDAAAEGFNTVQPALQTFYGTLDDEQKARLLRDMTAVSTQDKMDRRNRWRAYASADPKAEANQWGRMCELLTTALRGWPVREIERNVRLSETQRVAFYEFVTASLKAADTLVNSCPAETALTPVRRMDTMRNRLAAVRQAMVSIRPTLVRFYETLDNGQRVRFAAMS